MRFQDFFRFGVINLSRRKARTVLTALSMAIGVMCIIVLISVGIGYEKSYEETIQSMGSLTKIDVTPSTDERGAQALLNDKAVDAMKKLDGVDAVTPVVQATAYLKSGKYISMVKLYGLDLTTADQFLLTPEEGTMPGEGLRFKPEVMLTDDVAASFADPNQDWADAVDEDGNPYVDPMGGNIRLTFDYSALSNEQEAGDDGRAVQSGSLYRLNVTGLCSTLNYTFSTSGFLDRERLEEWIEANPAAAAQQQRSASSSDSNSSGNSGSSAESDREKAVEKAKGKTYDTVWVKVQDVGKVQEIAQTIRDAGFSTYSLNDMLETVRTQSRQIQGMLGAIGLIAMIVSGIGIANTMMMSINERTREVGVLKVLGTDLKDIAMMFLTEALLVGILGGIGGLLLSFVMARLIPVLFQTMQVKSIIPLWLAAGGVLFAGVVALLSALAPALNAMRISPNEAIRTE